MLSDEVRMLSGLWVDFWRKLRRNERKLHVWRENGENLFFFLNCTSKWYLFARRWDDGPLLNKTWPSSHLHVDILIYHIGTLNSPQCCWVYDVESLKKYPIECSNIMDHPPSRSVKSGRRFTVIRSEVNFHLHPKELTNNDIH